MNEDEVTIGVHETPSYRTADRTVSLLDQGTLDNNLAGQPGTVRFFREPVPDEEAVPEVILPIKRWKALGEPDCITVVVERGDQLNDTQEWSLLWADDEAVTDVWDSA